MSFFMIRYRAGMRWTPALCIAMAIFIFSATPGDEVHESYHNLETSVQSISPSIANSIPFAIAASPNIDWLKAAHGVGYFCLGVSVLYALSIRSRGSPGVALIMCSLYSITDEFHQMFIPGRSASPKDIVLDTLAALMGVAFMLGLMAARAFFKQKREPADQAV
jgi:VanZ family protein